MVEGAQKASATSLHSSLEQLSGGLSLKTSVIPAGMEEVAQATVYENVQLIKSIPSQYLDDVFGSVMRSITTGGGLADLIPAIRKYDGITDRRAKNIALDQTRKAYNSINKQRLMAVGIKKFRWSHSAGGQTPRQDHIAMDGKIFSFDDLPIIDRKTGERGIPGQAINCRCTMTPVYEFDSEDA
jgi:SPP1 gp7 family putative phage head morphogenesis protein